MDKLSTPGPILGALTLNDNVKYHSEVVEEYLSNKSSFTKFPSRHYRQLEVSFETGKMKTLFKRLRIPTEISTLIVGGYTGQFAHALHNLGMRVIFTDPLEEWVTKAEKSGLESYRYAAEEIPGTLLDKTQMAATFEGYGFVSPSKIYNMLRFLTRDYGLLFAESESTRKEIQADPRTASGGMKFLFLPFYKVYSIVRLSKEKGDLRFYHCHAPNPESKEMMLIDANVMKAVHENLPTETTLTLDNLLSLPGISAMGNNNLDQSLNRIMKLHYHDLPQSEKFEWARWISIGGKSFRLEETRLAQLGS